MITEEELESFYLNELEPVIKPMEIYRLKQLRRLRIFLWLAALSLLPIILVSYSRIPLLIVASILPMVTFIGLFFRKLDETGRALRDRFKYRVIMKIMKHLYDESEYIANQRIAKSVLHKSMLFPKYISLVKGEDFMRFKIGKSLMMFCETTVFTGQNQQVFKGIFMSSSFNKNFNSKTFVIDKKTSGFLLKIKRALLGNLYNVDVENSEFENHFYIISNNQVEARYILSTSLMQRILDYKKKINRPISLSFSENRMYCAIPKFVDLFEPPIFTPIDFDCIKKNYEPIKIYTDIVNDLNLNLRIWSKQ